MRHGTADIHFKVTGGCLALPTVAASFDHKLPANSLTVIRIAP